MGCKECVGCLVSNGVITDEPHAYPSMKYYMAEWCPISFKLRLTQSSFHR